MNQLTDYETDFYAWALHNAKLLREGRLSELDVKHLAFAGHFPANPRHLRDDILSNGTLWLPIKIFFMGSSYKFFSVRRQVVE